VTGTNWGAIRTIARGADKKKTHGSRHDFELRIIRIPVATPGLDKRGEGIGLVNIRTAQARVVNEPFVKGEFGSAANRDAKLPPEGRTKRTAGVEILRSFADILKFRKHQPAFKKKGKMRENQLVWVADEALTMPARRGAITQTKKCKKVGENAGKSIEKGESRGARKRRGAHPS